MSKAIVFEAFGGPEVLTLVEVDDPAPGPGEVAVRVAAAGINPFDAKYRTGFRPSGVITSPRRIGGDAAGTVEAVGDAVEGIRPGDAVVLSGVRGAYAERVIADQTRVFARPPQVSAAVGAALGTPFGTAYQSLRSLDVRAGDTLLVHAGSGAVGQAAIQFAVLWGARVVATCSPARFERVRALGATPIAYGDGLVGRIHEAASDGVDVVLDAAGTTEALTASLAVAADPARVATIVRGADAASLGIRAFSGGSPDPLTAREQHWRAEAMPVTLALLAAGTFSVELGQSFPLERAGDAHRALAQGAAGKLTLVP